MAVPARLWTGMAIAAMAGALVLRLYGLDLRSISHPEVYVPGIPLPLEHSVPPPRLTWADTLWMHYHDEPHPMGWYLAMLAWTGLAGVSEWALRLPGAVIGAASVWLAFLLGRLVFGGAAGALAAVLLALHGFHLFWSQMARMYVPGAFLGLLSTLLLLAFVYDGRRRALTGAGYVLSVAATATCIEFVWPLLGIQIVWATLVLPARGDFRWSDVLRARMAGVHPAIRLQMLAVMVSAPELLHSVYRARAGAVEQTGLAFLREYLSFGFLFVTDPAAIPPMALSAPLATLLLVGSLALVAGGLKTPAPAPRPAPAGGGASRPAARRRGGCDCGLHGLARADRAAPEHGASGRGDRLHPRALAARAHPRSGPCAFPFGRVDTLARGHRRAAPAGRAGGRRGTADPFRPVGEGRDSRKPGLPRLRAGTSGSRCRGGHGDPAFMAASCCCGGADRPFRGERALVLRQARKPPRLQGPRGGDAGSLQP
ncbi:glycosyltransferase family 39 protein [Albidovulum sp.]|uniref:glycosyltransferase family 39 protein n=1 Tax=Albidovulum sp. TaxID=1872424 RepID=UPI0039B95E94